VTPAELLLGRCPRSRLDLLKPHTAERVENKQLQQKKQHDRRAVDRRFEIGTSVFVKNYGPGSKWIPGVISRITGPMSFIVTLGDGRERRVHLDQIRKRTVEVKTPPGELSDTPEDDPTPEVPVDLPTDTTVPSPIDDSVPGGDLEPPTTSPEISGETAVTTPPRENTPSGGSTPPVVKTYPRRTRTTRVFFEPKW